ncbi:MAG: hypothetical protein M3Z66_24200 [Chloroflexota bacterium]|nr:hypothetical protein [Chloroflexota bacterium]
MGIEAFVHILATVIGFVIAWVGSLRVFLAVLPVVCVAEIGGGNGVQPRSAWRTWIPSGLLLVAIGGLLVSYGLGQAPSLTGPRAVLSGAFWAVVPLLVFSLSVLILYPVAARLGRGLGWTFDTLQWRAGEALIGTVLVIWWVDEYLSRSPRDISYLLLGTVFIIPTLLRWAWVWALVRDRYWK